MTVQEFQPQTTRGASSTAHELRTALHALAIVVSGPQKADTARTEQLLRTVIDVGKRSLRQGPLPARPFSYLGTSKPIGVGALLAEYADPGTTALSSLVSELDPGLLDELDGLLTVSDGMSAEAGARPQDAAAESDVHLVLAPVADWTEVARANIVFDAAQVERNDSSRGTVHAAWSALPPSAIAEAERALEVGRRYLADLGRPQPPQVTASIDLENVLNPSTVAPGACGAAVALSYLARNAELPPPAVMGVLPLAGCKKDGQWVPYPQRDTVFAYAEQEGLGCLWRDADGWRMKKDGASHSDPDSSLAGAARLLWGQRWEDVGERWALDTLDAHRWRILHTAQDAGRANDDWLRGDGAPLSEQDHVRWLAKGFHRRPQSLIIQSGTRNSGKTVIARQLVSLLEADDWQTVVISPEDRQLPGPGELSRIVQAALWATRSSTRRKTLVVLEDLHALGDGEIGKELSALRHLKVAVLAVTRYGGATIDWETHGVTAYLTQVRQADVRELAERLVTEYPQAYGPPHNARVELAAKECKADLRVLTDLLRKGAENPAVHRTDGEDLLRGQAARVRATLDVESISAVCRLAAVSIMDDSVPESQVAALSAATRQALGAVSRSGLVHIASRVRAEAVLAECDPQGLESLLTHTETYLLRMIEENAHARVRALLLNYAAYEPSQLAELLERDALQAALTDWAARAHPTTALRLLSLCGKQGAREWIAKALPSVIVRVPETPDLSVRDLGAALGMLWDYYYRLPDPALTRHLLEWTGAEGGGLDTVLGRMSSVSERLGFARMLLRLANKDTVHPEDICNWLLDRVDLLVRGADARSHRDLISVRRLDELLFRWLREAQSPDAYDRDGSHRRRPFEKSVQDLLSRQPTRDAPLAAVLAWMSLHLHFDGGMDWNSLIQKYEGQIRSGLARADAIEISSAFGDLSRNNRGLCTRLFNRLDLSESLVPTLKAASPAEAAILLSTVRNIHGHTVRELLYRPSGNGIVADKALARDLAESIRESKDGRGAGMLLSSTSRADDLYSVTRRGFAYQLATELGADFATRLLAARRGERRPSVIYHFLRGLWEAGADYRNEMEDHALRLVVSSIRAQRGSSRPWGPRLAMLLIEDDYFGQDFLRRLAEQLDVELLSTRMLNPELDPESMRDTHRLALALDPEAGREFARRIDLAATIRGQVSDRPANVAQKLRTTAGTLMAGGRRDATSQILGQFKREFPEWNWAERIRSAPRIMAFTDSLIHLRKLDPPAAREAATLLISSTEERYTHFQDLLFRSVVSPSLTADLLTTVERCLPGVGKRAFEDLRAQGNRWQTFREIFSYEQDPILQGIVGRRLAPLGLMPQTAKTRWMETLVTDRWAGTLPSMASPKAVEELLTLSHIWEPQWGEQLAACVNRWNLLHRLGQHMRPDLRVLPNLIIVLRLNGRENIAEEIVGLLAGCDPDDLMESMGLAQATRLLRSLHHADFPVDLLAPALGRLLEKSLRRPLAADAQHHWASIGWAAQTLTDIGHEHQIPSTKPVLEPNLVAFAGPVAWATTWLPSTDWSTATREAALDAFSHGGAASWRGQQACMALIASARAGRLAGITDLEARWSAAMEATPELLTLLCREAANSPALSTYLTSPKAAERMWSLLDRPESVTRIYHAELSASVNRLCPPRSTVNSIMGGTLDV
ncbi:hypothetical protein [Streptomyces sp. NPDC006638]|uniref:hypothetical protein n=1 Tax=Streptomyces sp. NPDC006638 TaxID=3157183 RepID=UPI0033A5683A